MAITAQDPDPYAGSIAFRSNARRDMTPGQIAATLSPGSPGRVAVLPDREGGYAIAELMAMKEALIVIHSPHGDEHLTVIRREELGKLYAEMGRIHGNMGGEVLIPELRIVSDSHPNIENRLFGNGPGNSVVPVEGPITFTDSILRESHLAISALLAIGMAQQLDYRDLDAGDRRLLAALTEDASYLEPDVLGQMKSDRLEAERRLAELTRHEPRILDAYRDFLLHRQHMLHQAGGTGHSHHNGQPTPEESLANLSRKQHVPLTEAPAWDQQAIDRFIAGCAHGSSQDCAELDKVLTAPAAYTLPRQEPGQRSH